MAIHLTSVRASAIPASVLICLGLSPALHITGLQLALLLLLIGVAVQWRKVRNNIQSGLAMLWHWPTIAIVQFLILLLANALLFAPWEGNIAAGRDHYRQVALENWASSLIVLLVFLIWLPSSGLTRALWRRWLPAGLVGSFLIGSGYYFFTEHQGRVWILSPNPLLPPLWFFILTLLSFCWWESMSHWQKIIRLGLYALAGLMAVYGGSRAILIAWVLVLPMLGFYLARLGSLQNRGRFWIATLLATLTAGALLWIGNEISKGFLALRFEMFFEGPFTYESLSKNFERLSVWAAAWAVARDNLWIGVGQVNERIAIHEVLGWDSWYRAHQTYLSWIIGGGIPLLISGLIFKAPVLNYLNRSMLPAFLGLGVVLTLNELTNSVFQSAVSVQLVMVLFLLLHWMKNEDART